VTGVADTDRVGLFSSCLPGWDAQRVIDVARGLRFAVVEWGAGPGQAIELGHDGAALRELCAAAGLSISGLSVQDPAVSAGTPKAARSYLKLAIALGAGFMRLLAPAYRGGPLGREEREARIGLDAVIDLAATEGVAVLIETSPGTLAPSAERAVGLVEHRRPEDAGVLFDPGNTVIEGYLAPALAVARLGPYLRHVHVKNVAWRRSAGGDWEWRHAPLTGGMVVWAEVFDALRAAGYQGGFSIDHLSARPTRERLRAETQHLRTLAGRRNDTQPRKEREPSPARV
jgi:sugar phosphate isomerase/epimerase